jgi:hypothetical protein
VAVTQTEFSNAIYQDRVVIPSKMKAKLQTKEEVVRTNFEAGTVLNFDRS